MKKSLIGLLIIGALFSCGVNKEEATNYYDNIINIYLEFEANRKEAIISGNKLLEQHYSSSSIDSFELAEVFNKYNNIVRLCKENKEKIGLIGAFQQDTSMISASIDLYNLSEAIFANEFPELLRSVQKGEISHSVEQDMQRGLLQYVIFQKDLINAEIRFQYKYDLDIQLKDLEDSYKNHIKSIERAEQVINGVN